MNRQEILTRAFVGAVWFLLPLQIASVQTETPSFDSDASADAAGEGGRLLHRSFGLPIGFYADTTIGELTLEMPFMAAGKLTLQNIDFDGHAYLGFSTPRNCLTTHLISAPKSHSVLPNLEVAWHPISTGGICSRTMT